MAGAVPGPIAAPNLAIDDRRPERLLGHPVGGRHPWQTQEAEEGVELAVEMAEEATLGTIGAADRTRQLGSKLALQLVQLGLEVMLGDLVASRRSRSWRAPRRIVRIALGISRPRPRAVSSISRQRRSRCATQVWCTASLNLP
jgi:hypothetical protein